jgi:hypothetical protein
LRHIAHGIAPSASRSSKNTCTERNWTLITSPIRQTEATWLMCSRSLTE